MNHFIDIREHDIETLREILNRAAELKTKTKAGEPHPLLAGKHLAMVFDKPSTRTRVSFEVGINQLGGHAVILDSASSQLGQGETIGDTAGVLSRYVDIIMIRTFRHQNIKELAQKASVPVINGLTDFSHPCQVMTDILTIEEHRGAISGKTVAWVGDYNNMAESWIQAASLFGFTLNLAMPQELAPSTDGNEHIHTFLSAEEAVCGADVVTTDTWVSMGDTDAEQKKTLLAPYQVNDAIMAEAAEEAIFLHCLPAHRDEEVTASVLDGPQSVVFDEAENRLHTQKAIMLWCLGK